MTYIQHVVDMQPENDEGWYNLGKVYEELHHVEEAIISYQRAIALSSADKINYLYTLSMLYVNNDQFEQGVKLLEKALDDDPDSTDLYSFLASLYIKNNDYQQVELLLKKVEEIDPDAEMLLAIRSLLALKQIERPSSNKQIEQPSSQKRPLKFSKQKGKRR